MFFWVLRISVLFSVLTRIDFARCVTWFTASSIQNSLDRHEKRKKKAHIISVSKAYNLVWGCYTWQMRIMFAE